MCNNKLACWSKGAVDWLVDSSFSEESLTSVTVSGPHTRLCISLTFSTNYCKKDSELMLWLEGAVRRASTGQYCAVEAVHLRSIGTIDVLNHLHTRLSISKYTSDKTKSVIPAVKPAHSLDLLVQLAAGRLHKHDIACSWDKGNHNA